MAECWGYAGHDGGCAHGGQGGKTIQCAGRWGCEPNHTIPPYVAEGGQWSWHVDALTTALSLAHSPVAPPIREWDFRLGGAFYLRESISWFWQHLKLGEKGIIRNSTVQLGGEHLTTFTFDFLRRHYQWPPTVDSLDFQLLTLLLEISTGKGD